MENSIKKENEKNSYLINAQYYLHPDGNKKTIFSIRGVLYAGGSSYVLNRDYILTHKASSSNSYKINNFIYDKHETDNADKPFAMDVVFPKKPNSSYFIKLFKLNGGAILVEDAFSPIFVCALGK
ncbi:hypothetical protein ACXGPA_21990 (plasmid) [Enterobacter asburiae]